MIRPVAIDGALVLHDGMFRTGCVLVEGRHVTALAWSGPDRAALRARGAEQVDGAGCWLIPGLVDAHAHAYGALLRGTENSLPLELWALHTTVLGRALDAPAVHAAILLGAAERIRAGITGTIDHAPAMHLAETSLAAHERSGLRVAYAPFLHDLSDYDLLGIALPDALAPLVAGPPPLDEEAYAARFATLVETARAGSGRVRVQLGPNAPQRCSPAAWALWRRLRDRHDVDVHTHLLETRAQAMLGRRYPGGLVAAMAREGMLDRLTCAHGVWLTPPDRDILARHDVTLSHNPASNLMLGSGIMPWQACTACGLRVALGTDSANTGGRHDLFEVMRLALMLPRRDGGDPAGWPRHAQLLDMATRHAAAALGLEGRLGRIAPGQLADLVLLRGDTAATLACDPGVAALVQHAGPAAVDAVMVDGTWLLRDGRILAFDEAAALRDAAGRIAALAPDRTTLQGAMPALTRRFLQVAASCG